MGFSPSLGSKVEAERRARFAAGMSGDPAPEILGTIPNTERITDERTTSTWTREDGTVVELTEPAPPWALEDERFTPSDARRFVECPPQWRLRWINPRLLDSEGWRDWQAVMASDPRVKVRVDSMVTPENYLRRGGPGGDILAWMWEGWYQAHTKKIVRKTQELAQTAVNKQEQLKAEFARGTYGAIKLEDARHPTHTNADGRSMRD